MGSIGEARYMGFMCRLCSKAKKTVIHFYSSRGKELDLLNKLKLLPISVSKNDRLPQTVCDVCIEKLNLQYNLVMRIRKNDSIIRTHQNYHGDNNCSKECILHGHNNG